MRALPLLLSLCWLPAIGAPLAVLTEQNAPFNFQEDEQSAPTGLSTEVVREMFRRAHLPYRIELLPWARGISRALTQTDTCIYSAARTPDREAQFNWIGPIALNHWALFARSDFSEPLRRLDDAKRFRIGTPRLDAKTAWLQARGFTNLEIVADDSYSPRMLEAGRFDLWISGAYKGRALAQSEGVRTLRQVLMVNAVDYYLACSKSTSDAEITALNAALANMRMDGWLRHMQDSYTARLGLEATH